MAEDKGSAAGGGAGGSGPGAPGSGRPGAPVGSGRPGAPGSGRPGGPAARHVTLDAEELAGQSYPYQHDISLVAGVDLEAATPGPGINWLEDVHLLVEDGTPAVFDRYSNSFLKIYFPIPEGREDEIARKVLVSHLTQGSSYGIALKRQHAKFAQPLLGPWVEGSETVGTSWKAPSLAGWEKPGGH